MYEIRYEVTGETLATKIRTIGEAIKIQKVYLEQAAEELLNVYPEMSKEKAMKIYEADIVIVSM